MLDAKISSLNGDQMEFIFPTICLNKKVVKLIELFGGIGSQSKAFEILSKYYPTEINYNHHKLIEFDKHCIDTYNAIHNTEFSTMDITKISYRDLEIKNDDNIYVMTYSFPCQDLSLAGKRRGMEKGSGTRSSLLWEVERLLKEGRKERLPEILLMENVPQVNDNKNRYWFNIWKQTLKELGYSNYVKKLNAKNYGICQSRCRCFMVSVLGNECYYFPPKIEDKRKFKEFLESKEEIDRKYYISDRAIQNFLVENAGGYNRQIRFLRNIDKERKCASTILTATGCSASDNYVLEDENIELSSLKKEPNIKMKDILANNVRKITPKECFRLTGFSNADFLRAELINTNTQLYKQAGNSIVVTALIAIFARLYDGIDYENVINQYVDKEILNIKKRSDSNKIKN